MMLSTLNPAISSNENNSNVSSIYRDPPGRRSSCSAADGNETSNNNRGMFPAIVLSPTSTTQDSGEKRHELSDDSMSFEFCLSEGLSDDDDDDEGEPSSPDPPTRQHQQQQSPDDNDCESNLPKTSTTIPEAKRHAFYYCTYISALAIIASTLRVYISRFFGSDCENQDVNDFLTPLSTRICVTAGGLTLQTGGALFLDLPANMLGSFVMGLITPKHGNTSRIPWLHRDHPLQSDDVFHTALGVGFCGCLTTFASWNVQMVMMMEGTYCELGSQVVSALCGYAIGFMCAISSFRSGRKLSYWMYCRRYGAPDNNNNTKNKSEAKLRETVSIPIGGVSFRTLESRPSTEELDAEATFTAFRFLCFRPMHLLFVVSAVLVGLFVWGGIYLDIAFYRDMLLMAPFASVGALLRWRVSALPHNPERSLLPWFPWGTFESNCSGAVTAALVSGLSLRYGNLRAMNPWIEAVFFAAKTGFAGSLSTVSSMVKEMTHLSELYPGHAKSQLYGTATALCGMALGLSVYAAVVRAF